MHFAGDSKEPGQSAKAPQPIAQTPPKPPEVAIEPKSKSTSASPPREGVKPGSTVLPVAGSQTIDLLALADPARHAAVGRWEVQQSGLAILQQTMCGLIQFPVIPAGGFEYETEFTRLSGDGAICLLFPVGNSFVNVEVSGDHGRYSGMGQVNGRGTNSASNPTSRPNSISNNVRYKLAVRVRPSADNQITISEFLDGSELFRWQGDVSALSGSPFLRMHRPATLALAADSAVAVFHAAHLRMLDGRAKNVQGQVLAVAAAQDRPRGEPADVAEPTEKVAETSSEPRPAAEKPEKPEPSVTADNPASNGPQVPAKKIAPPSADEQKRLMAAIDEVYKAGGTKKVALARKLLEDGRKNESNRAEQFVLLRRAGEIAREAGEADLMLEAVDAIFAAGFDIQPFQVKARLLKQLVSQSPSGDDFQLLTIGTSCLKFAEQAAAGGAVDEASDVLDAAKKLLAKPIMQAQAALRAAKAALARARTPADKAEREKKLEDAQGELDAIKSTQSALAECAKRFSRPGVIARRFRRPRNNSRPPPTTRAPAWRSVVGIAFTRATGTRA